MDLSFAISSACTQTPNKKLGSSAENLRPYHKRHRECGIDFAPNEYGGGAVFSKASQHTRSSKRELSVAILQASRQLHDEAALMPFAENTFAFQDDCEVEVFLKQIVLHQAHAIRSIVLAPRVYGQVLPMSPSRPTARMLLSKLKGLGDCGPSRANSKRESIGNRRS